jgi:methionyl-tRNA synthetase
MNKYIDESEPWILSREESKKSRLSTVMYNLVDALEKIAVLVSPFMPDTSKKMLEQLGLDESKERTLNEIKNWGSYPANNKLGKATPIFPRLEYVEKAEEDEFIINENLIIDNIIAIADFSKIQIKVVEILNVSKVDGADKLLKFIIDTGTEKRQIVSGIAKYYTNIEELVGRKVLAITNLEPVTLRNELSQGMLLTTEEKKRTQLIEVSHDVKLGSLVK